MLPPPEGRRSRLGHISIDDFAQQIGSTRQRVIEWEGGSAYPDKKNRDRLAAASGGVYRPDDFRRQAEEQAVERWRDKVDRHLQQLAKDSKELYEQSAANGLAIGELRERIARLEGGSGQSRVRPRRPRPGG